MRWGIVLVLISLHIVMKAPVWALIAKVGVIAGSTGWHRYELVDKAITRFGEWWLLGVKSTAPWGFEMDDMINQYVAEGVKGGVLCLALFIAAIVLCFRTLGLAMRSVADRKMQLTFWAFGVSLLTHVIGFFGVSYWDQQMVVWYMLLAMISAVKSKLAIPESMGGLQPRG